MAGSAVLLYSCAGAGVVFGGGFPREDSAGARRAAQRAIFHVQRGLESVADTHDAAIVLCDRGTMDGIAYWPGPSDFWSSVGTSEEKELGRYDAVIHVRTPSAVQGDNHENPLRIESAAAAAEVDERILAAWHDHPRRWVVESSPDFLTKAKRAIDVLRGEMPLCCAQHELPRGAFKPPV